MKLPIGQIITVITIAIYAIINIPKLISQTAISTVGFIADIATIAGVMGVAYTIKAYTHNAAREQQKDAEDNIIRSVKLITAFNSQTIELLNNFDENYTQAVQEYINTSDFRNNKITIVEAKRLKNKFKLEQCKADKILNQIQIVASYVVKDVCDEKMIKDKIGNIIIPFCEKQKDLITDLELSNHNYNELKELTERWGNSYGN